MKITVRSSLGWQPIQVLELSLKVAVEYARFVWQLVRRASAGGARVIYYWAIRRDLILLLFAYSKNVSADLTPRQLSQLAKVAREELRDETETV